MKTLLKRSVVLWLSLAVLLSSVGLTVSEHICLVSGKVMLSYDQKEDPCTKHGKSDCKKPGEEVEIKKKCCEFKLDQHKLELASQVKLTHFSFAWVVQPVTFYLSAPTVLQPEQEVLQYTNSSPPLYGKNLLYSLHVLRV